MFRLTSLRNIIAPDGFMKAETSLQEKDDEQHKLVNAKLCTEGEMGAVKSGFVFWLLHSSLL